MSSTEKAQPEVPGRVFEEFLIRLTKSEIPTEVVERLRKTVIQEKNLSEKAIKSALFQIHETDDQG
jgi:hypothetical protein